MFDAWTDAEGMRRWMCPREGFTTEAVLDPRVGGSFRIVMKGPQRDYEHSGEYQVMDPPHKLAFTWISE